LARKVRNQLLMVKNSRLQKRVKSNIRRAIKDTRARMLEMNDTKNAWRFIREVTFTSAKGIKICMDLSVLNEAFASTVTVVHLSCRLKGVITRMTSIFIKSIMQKSRGSSSISGSVQQRDLMAYQHHY